MIFPAQPSITGTSGGPAGAIYNYLLLDPNIAQYFSGNIYAEPLPKIRTSLNPPTVAPQIRFPAIAIHGQEVSPYLESDRFLLEPQIIEVAVYAVGMSNADWLGRYVTAYLLSGQDAMTAYGFKFTLMPSSPSPLVRDPEVSEMGGPVWCRHLRFSLTLGMPV